MRKTLLAAAVAAALLAACGGGDDDNVATVPPATSEVPASASQSPDGFIAYLQLLVASVADMLEPVDTAAALPPADDTGEPKTVD